MHIHKPDGTTVVEHYKLADDTVMLQPDVREHFPDSDAVNTALRSLITLLAEMPGKHKTHTKKLVVQDGNHSPGAIRKR